LVDTNALVQALQNQSIGGAAVDVFDIEPMPADHPLRTTPIHCSPHTLALLRSPCSSHSPLVWSSV
jgi:phosphoglycerate dehydrogenase-like enzyme